ncbi:MAG: undecaprenyl/decaprenyl-phosphate alpha-N-acetylglucosaminyl 1-phosphate transferase [Streptosporangiales bacterium]|nr:undecaprenyl/decaprenyl-phosphate alpha-N-acetylglucosaminyl 1-phosphate transferase [Streptosporangiales bacterium]
MREYALTLLVAAAVTYLVTPLVRNLAVKFGAITAVRARDVHSVPTPRIGGLAMFAGMAAGLLVASELRYLRDVFQGPTWQGLLMAGALITVVGVIDDRWGMDAFTKFAGQVAASGILVWKGVQLVWLPLPGGTWALPREVLVFLTILLIVVTINAVNFVDGLDGLAAGIVGIAAAAFFTYYYVFAVAKGYDRQVDAAMIAALLVGMCAGFLPHNFNPARIFMGDTGSMLIGLLLASATISITGQFDIRTAREFNGIIVLLPLLLPLLVLALPFLDLLLAVVRRTAAGRSPFAPDKKHLHHRLLEIGHTHRRAVLLMYLWAAIIAFATVTLSIFNQPFVVLGVAVLVAGGAVLLMTLPRIKARRAAGAQGTADQMGSV